MSKLQVYIPPITTMKLKRLFDRKFIKHVFHALLISKADTATNFRQEVVSNYR